MKIFYALTSNLNKKLNLRFLSHDMYVGKPDKLSNVRPLVFKYNDTDTKLEKKLKDIQYEAQKWHHKFWLEHNKKYVKSHKDYMQANALKDKKDTDSMATFHRQFLVENNAVLRKYDKEWKKLNRTIIYLMAVSTLQRFFLNFFCIFKQKKKES